MCDCYDEEFVDIEEVAAEPDAVPQPVPILVVRKRNNR